MKKLLLGLIVLFTVFSCKKSEVDSTTVEAPKSDISLSKGGYIQFKDIKAFKTTLTELKKMNDEQLKEWETKNGVKSLRSKFIEMKEGDSPGLNPIEEPYFAAVVNNQGVFAIGSEIHVVTYEKEYLISNDNQKELAKVLDNNITLSSNLKAFNIERKVFDSANKSKVNSSSTEKLMSVPNNATMWSGDRTTIEPECGNNGRPERVKLMAFVNNYASYGVIGVKILGEAFRKGGVFGSKSWRSDEIYYGKIEGTADFTYDNGLFNIPYSVEGYGGEEIRKTIYDYYTTPFYGSINANYIDATYTYQKNTACPSTTKFIHHN